MKIFYVILVIVIINVFIHYGYKALTERIAEVKETFSEVSEVIDGSFMDVLFVEKGGY